MAFVNALLIQLTGQGLWPRLLFINCRAWPNASADQVPWTVGSFLPKERANSYMVSQIFLFYCRSLNWMEISHSLFVDLETACSCDCLCNPLWFEMEKDQEDGIIRMIRCIAFCIDGHKSRKHVFPGSDSMICFLYITSNHPITLLLVFMLIFEHNCLFSSKFFK